MTKDIENTLLGPVSIYVRAFVTPPPVEEIPTRTLRDAEAIALKIAMQ